MKYILEGKAAEKVIRENRIRVSRGLVTFTPVDDADTADTKEVEVADAKEVESDDTKEVKEEETKEAETVDTKEVKQSKKK